MTSNAILKGIKASFASMMDTAKPNPLAPLAETVQSEGKNETYYIPLVAGGVQELLDEVQFAEIQDKSYTIENKDFFNSLRVDRNTMEDSNEYMPAAAQMMTRKISDEWQNFPNQKMEELLRYSTSGKFGTAFDGTFFFSTSRPNISTAISTGGIANTSTGTGTTLATIETDFGTAKVAMMGFKDKNNNPLNRDADWYVLCPVALVDTFERLLNPTATIIDSTGTSKSNIYAGAAKVIPIYNTTGNTWYLVNGNAQVKPFIYQIRQNPEFFMEDDQKKKTVDYWYKARAGFGYGAPWAAYRTVQ